MFCIKCGRKAEIENLCEKCFLDGEELFSIEDFRLQFCNCGSYYNNKWQRPEEEEKVIIKEINKRIKTKNKITKKDIDIKKVGNRILATVTCSGFIRPAKKAKTEKKSVTIILKSLKCEKCVKTLGGYYEAVLQARGKNAEKILKEIKELAPESGLIKLKEGYDIRFIKKGEAKRIANYMKGKYQVKESFSLVAVKKGKKLYRNYYSIK